MTEKFRPEPSGEQPERRTGKNEFTQTPKTGGDTAKEYVKRETERLRKLSEARGILPSSDYSSELMEEYMREVGGLTIPKKQEWDTGEPTPLVIKAQRMWVKAVEKT